jgi:hypothetical protein
MKRPGTHRAGDLAESMVEQAFVRNNWVVNRQYSDYGFDIFVQYLEPAGGANSALIQVKGLMSTPKWKDGSFTYRVERRYVQYWNLTPEPVYLCIVDIENSKIFATNALNIKVDPGDHVKSVPIPFTDASELSAYRFAELVSEVRRWWAIVRFLKMSYTSLGEDPTKQMIQTDRAGEILTSGLFGLVTTRAPLTQRQIERYIDLIHVGNTTETCVEIAQISGSLATMSPLDEVEIRNLVNAFVKKMGKERWRPPDLLKLVRALGNLGRSRPVSDGEWLTWMDVSA